MSQDQTQRAPSPILPALCLAADAALVTAFAAVGNRTHESGLSAADIWSTAWPFLVGLVMGWIFTQSWRQHSTLWPAGAFVVIYTVALGMTFRHFLTDGGVQLSFVLVATGTLMVLLLGRRLLTTLLLPRS